MTQSFVEKNVGASLDTAAAVIAALFAGNGAANGVEVDGLTIDRNALATLFLSGKFVIPCDYTGASNGDTCTIAIQLQDSDDGSAWTDVGAPQSTVATAVTGALDVDFTAEYDVDLSGLRRYVRIQVTPTLSGVTAGDTLGYAGALVLGGGQEA